MTSASEHFLNGFLDALARYATTVEMGGGDEYLELQLRRLPEAATLRDAYRAYGATIEGAQSDVAEVDGAEWVDMKRYGFARHIAAWLLGHMPSPEPARAAAFWSEIDEPEVGSPERSRWAFVHEQGFWLADELGEKLSDDVSCGFFRRRNGFPLCLDQGRPFCQELVISGSRRRYVLWLATGD